MKLSLDDFKAMANNVQSEEVMQQIEGGLLDLFDCHGFWGQVGKACRDWGEFLDAHPKL